MPPRISTFDLTEHHANTWVKVLKTKGSSTQVNDSMVAYNFPCGFLSNLVAHPILQYQMHSAQMLFLGLLLHI